MASKFKFEKQKGYCEFCCKRFDNETELEQHQSKGDTCRWDLYIDVDSKSRWNEKLKKFHGKKAQLRKGARTKSEEIVEEKIEKILTNKRNRGRFSTNPQLGGSYKTGLKIHKPNEFDYTVRLNVPDSCRFSGSHAVEFQYIDDMDEVDSDDSCRKTTRRDIDVDREIEDAGESLPPVGYKVVKLRYSRAKEFWDAVYDDVLLPYEVLVQFHSFIKEAVKDVDDVDVVKVNGPAITLKIRDDRVSHSISVDLTPMIKIGRAGKVLKKYGWPRPDTREWLKKREIQWIRDTKIILVPKKDKFWRISFCECENELFDDIDDNEEVDGIRKMVLRICKAKLKIWKSEAGGTMRGISSYILKTLMLWLCEFLNDEDDWEKEELSARYCNFMMELRLCLKRRYLGEYFIPDINLLANKTEEEITEFLSYVEDELKDMKSLYKHSDYKHFPL